MIAIVAILSVSNLVSTQDSCYTFITPITLSNFDLITRTDFLFQIDTQNMKTKGLINESACQDLEFFNGSSKLDHWFETSCPSSKTNIWIRGEFA